MKPVTCSIAFGREPAQYRAREIPGYNSSPRECGRVEETQVACWSQRGCDPAMERECPHAIDPLEQCPASCFYAKCYRPQHRTTGDPTLVFDPFVDRRAAAKEGCTACVFFLQNAPRGG